MVDHSSGEVNGFYRPRRYTQTTRQDSREVGSFRYKPFGKSNNQAESEYSCHRSLNSHQPPSSLVIHPRDQSDADNTVKIVIVNDKNTSIGSGSSSGIEMGKSHVIESGNLIISVQVLKNVTKNFSHEKELGCGGFGVIYKGQLHDGTKIAVKRIEAGVISNKALDEFQIWTKFSRRQMHTLPPLVSNCPCFRNYKVPLIYNKRAKLQKFNSMIFRNATTGWGMALNHHMIIHFHNMIIAQGIYKKRLNLNKEMEENK
ncbi:hypothetical protein LXL04_021011 [Taraxacum kok-saghyz]